MGASRSSADMAFPNSTNSAGVDLIEGPQETPIKVVSKSIYLVDEKETNAVVGEDEASQSGAMYAGLRQRERDQAIGRRAIASDVATAAGRDHYVLFAVLSQIRHRNCVAAGI